MSPAAMQIRGLCKRFPEAAGGELTVLDHIDLEVRHGEFLSFIGPSGCGKSTLLKILGGLDQPSSGAVEADEDRLAFVFQRPLLLPWRTVLENVTFSLECRGKSSKVLRREAEEVLQKMGLSDYLRYKPHDLSRGMCQRVDLARALLVRPKILLMDEPFASLDVDTRAAMHCELLLRWKEQGFTVLFVSHALDEVVFLSDRVVFLSDKPCSISEIVDIPLPRPRAMDAESKVALVRLVEQFTRHLHDAHPQAARPAPAED